MGDTKDRVGAAGVIVAGGFFKIALYVCVAVLVIWIGKVTYQFGYNVFNQALLRHEISVCQLQQGNILCFLMQMILWSHVVLMKWSAA